MIRLIPLLILLAGCRSTKDCETVEWTYRGEVKQVEVCQPTFSSELEAVRYFLFR
jgi:hypothetical protein